MPRLHSFFVLLKMGSVHSIEKIKGTAYKNGDVDGTCKRGTESEYELKVPAW